MVKSTMKNILIILGLSLLNVNAANVYVRSAAVGANNGTDWANAYTTLPGGMIRGNTYYVAAGSYGGQFVAAVAGTTPILVKKATIGDHGTSTGWSDSYASGQAVWSTAGVVMNLQCSNITFDGVTGTGESGHGFRFSTVQGAEAVIKINNGFFADNVTFRHTEFHSTSYGGGSATRLWYNSSALFNGHTFQYCYFHDAGAAWISESTGSNFLAEYCAFSKCGSDNPAQHCAGFVFGGINSNYTIRYNTIRDMLLNGSTTYIEPQGAASTGLYIYGNSIRETLGNSGCSQGIFAITASDICQNVYIYNNTIWGLHSPLPGISGGNVPGSSVVVVNNVWQNCVFNPNFNGPGTSEISNIKNTGVVSFVDPNNGNFHLNVNTVNGVTLLSPFNQDPDGAARVPGSWSIGQYQFAGVVVPQPPNTPTIISPLNGATDVSLTPTITGSAFSDPQNKTHSDTEWLIKQGVNTIFDIVSGAPTTVLNIGAGLLANSTTYTANVRYKNTPYNLWSSWSPSVNFTTLAVIPPPPIEAGTNYTYKFNGEIILKGAFILVNTNQ